MKIYPIVNYLDRPVAFAQATIASLAGAHGLFLKADNGNDDELVAVAADIKRQYPFLDIGVSLMSKSAPVAVAMAANSGLDMVWADMGVTHKGLTSTGMELSRLATSHPRLRLFSSLVIGHHAMEIESAQAANNAKIAGFVPTASSTEAGAAPNLASVIRVSTLVAGNLAVASGLTPDNISSYAPYVDHALATGIGIGAGGTRININKLRMFVENAERRAA
jgi:hypothetical protein